MYINNDISVNVTDPMSLSMKDFERLNEVTQDMWADGLWEFIKCNDCWEIQWKQEIFWSISTEIYKNTVSEIMRILWTNEISCPFCWGKTSYIYWPENIDAIHERLTKSESLLVLCRDAIGNIVGYMDMYIDNFDVIFRRELKSHYGLIWANEIKNRVDKILWKKTTSMISFSAMWMTKEYMSMYHIFKIWNTLSSSVIPERYLSMPGITELDRNNNLSSLYEMMWSNSLWIFHDKNLNNKIINTGKAYSSDLVVFDTPIIDFKTKFSIWIKQFLRKYHKQRKLKEPRKNLQ